MKKFYSFFMALCLSVMMVNAKTVETVLWEDTYVDGVEINSAAIATFKAGDILRVYVTVPESGANFKIVYKGAPDWSETTIPSITTQWPWVNGGETYKDFALTEADLTAFSGKNIYVYKGDNSTIVKVSLLTEDHGGTTAIDNTNANAKATKIIRNGQVVILRDNKEYSIFGYEL